MIRSFFVALFNPFVQSSICCRLTKLFLTLFNFHFAASFLFFSLSIACVFTSSSLSLSLVISFFRSFAPCKFKVSVDSIFQFDEQEGEGKKKNMCLLRSIDSRLIGRERKCNNNNKNVSNFSLARPQIMERKLLTHKMILLPS